MVEFKSEVSRSLMTKYRNAINETVAPHMRELNKPSTLSYREQLSKLYFEIESITEKMDTYLKMCQEHPEEISKFDSIDVSIFISEIDVLIKDSFELFVKFSEK